MDSRKRNLGVCSGGHLARARGCHAVGTVMRNLNAWLGTSGASLLAWLRRRSPAVADLSFLSTCRANSHKKTALENCQFSRLDSRPI